MQAHILHMKHIANYRSFQSVLCTTQLLMTCGHYQMNPRVSQHYFSAETHFASANTQTQQREKLVKTYVSTKIMPSINGQSQPDSWLDLLEMGRSVSYTHLRAHETRHDLVCR